MGELRHVTLLCASGVGDRAPLIEVIERHGGTLEAGEALLVSVGRREPAPDAAKSAVRAALALADLDVRVGVHAGRVEVSDRLTGEAVEVVARLAAAAPAGRVWISRPVQEVVRRFFNLHAA